MAVTDSGELYKATTDNDWKTWILVGKIPLAGNSSPTPTPTKTEVSTPTKTPISTSKTTQTIPHGEEKGIPGFEVILAVIALLGAVHIVRRWRR